MDILKKSPLTTYVLLVVLSICVDHSEQQSVETESMEGDGRTLGHVIRGGHALAETFIGGLFDGSYHLGNHIGQLASPGRPVAVPQVFHLPGMVPLYVNPGYGCGYGYGGGCLLNSPPVGHFPGGPEPIHYGYEHSALGLHRPGFEGTYMSRPLHRFDRGSSGDYEPVLYDDIETDKTLFR